MDIHSHGDALRRRAEILRIVLERPVHSQDELAAILRAEGFTVAQPTLSRDIRELGLAKSSAGYAAPASGAPLPALPPPAAFAASLDRVLREGVLSARRAGTLVVLKTPPAGASPVAQVVDRAGLPGVVGTIAGDDTVFLAAAGPAAAARIVARIESVIAPGRRSRHARH